MEPGQQVGHFLNTAFLNCDTDLRRQQLPGPTSSSPCGLDGSEGNQYQHEAHVVCCAIRDKLSKFTWTSYPPDSQIYGRVVSQPSSPCPAAQGLLEYLPGQRKECKMSLIVPLSSSPTSISRIKVWVLFQILGNSKVWMFQEVSLGKYRGSIYCL